jgi:CubicO group peptidase (beta-lactamase class C family)
MRPLAFAFALLLSVVIPNQGSAQDVLPDSVIIALKKGVEGFKDRFHSPSIVVAIVHDKKIIFSEAIGYTDVEKKIPATIESRYPLLSLTKTFTATMFMQLVERKTINLVDDVKKYLPEFKGNPASSNNSATTLLQLACRCAFCKTSRPVASLK